MAHSHGSRFTRVSTAALAVVLLTGCELGSRPRRAHVRPSNEWLESAHDWTEVSSDSRWALQGKFGYRERPERGVELLHLPSRQSNDYRLRGGLAEVYQAVFNADDHIIRLGRRGQEEGWFLPGPQGPRLSSLPAAALPRFAPDHERVAYCLRGTAATRVFIGGIEDVAPAAIEVPGRITGLAWHPSGEAVLAMCAAPDGTSALLRISPELGDVETLTSGLDADPQVSPFALSRDGGTAYVALAELVAPPAQTRNQALADRDLDIYAVDLHTDECVRVAGRPGDDIAPRVTREALYWTHNRTTRAVVMLPVTGKPIHVILNNADAPYWHPDGQRLGFTYGDRRLADGGLNLEGGSIAVDAEARPLGEVELIVQGFHQDLSPTWSPDGRFIAYHSRRSDTALPEAGAAGGTDDIYLRPADGSSTEVRLTDFGHHTTLVDWAPDSERLLFGMTSRESGRRELWVITLEAATGRAKSHEPVPLPDSIRPIMAAWSPDGGHIAIESEDIPGSHALWTIREDGSRPRKVRSYAASTSGGVDWMPHGNRLVYAALAGGRMQLFSIGATGGRPTLLTRDSANVILPQVSPDGRFIAATRFEQSKELCAIALPPR